jgi:quinol monooxygenase YgiN
MLPMPQPYTLATYRAIPGKEEDLIRTWNDLAMTFLGLSHPPHWAILIRSTRDPTLFHAFGAWENAEHMTAMRESPEAEAAFKAIQNLCVETLPGDYELVAHIQIRDSTVKSTADPKASL